jgi:hypothetical protein
MSSYTRKALLILLVFTFSGELRASDINTILDKIILTYGGEQNLLKLDNMVQEWDMLALIGNRQGSEVRSVRAPGQLRAHLSYPEKFETRILNDDSAYTVFGNNPPETVSGIQKDAMKLQLMRVYSPLMLQKKLESLSLVEQGDMLAISLVENGLHVHYLVNQENWQIEKVAGSLMAGGREIQFLTEYSDFRFVDGVLMHFHESKFAAGTNTAKLQMRKVTLDADLEDDLFKP